MTYLYEQLDAERFQKLCQAMLVQDYPDLRCYPVGQPDGGRDGFTRLGGSDGDEETVLQLKFRRLDQDESAEWMIEALQKELPKIERLIERGARRYLMVTNARATAHLDVGRHDLVQKWLDEHLRIPAQVLWRDEIDRRIDGLTPLKLSYPAILSGTDTIALILEAQMGATRERLGRTIKAFVSEQFRKDEEVKFRQVDLTNSLLNLFVDVPVDISELIWDEEFGHDAYFRTSLDELASRRDTMDLEADYMWQRSLVNTADFLLDAQMQKSLPWTVLQGAPGQGKSTLAQYVCQVHRARLLEKESFTRALRPPHAQSPFRLPFKVDLRDYASYLDGKAFLNSPNPDREKARSLEKFLAHLVSIQSGGREFSPDDLAQVFASSPVLLFMDGLDEVADVKLRKRVVEAATQGLGRLRDGGLDIQVVVTTRPSLFGKKASFGPAFRTLELAPIDEATIVEYADKWIAARRLDHERSAEVRDILRLKLDQPHIRELTRNPMQLAILLNLILSIGHSLPDARTSLYSEYVKLFMTREAEKSSVVRRHRAILSGIVEHLAWILQSGAETDRGSGSIDEPSLRSEVGQYLARGQHDTKIVDELFTDGIERVWVLVQRVEGLFEFEVQPLREYFAAKHLYSSAPVLDYRHQNHGGDRSERFEAIATSPYWANVARFYAGFYQPGEIAGIGSSLKELAGGSDVAKRILARNTAVELLADWIFNLKKPIQNEVLNLAFDHFGLQLASARFGAYENVTLPSECGRDRLGELLMEQLVARGALGVPNALAMLLRRNGGTSLTPQLEAWARSAEGPELSARLRLAISSGAAIDGAQYLDMATIDSPDASVRWKRARHAGVSCQGLMWNAAGLSSWVLEQVLDTGGFRARIDHPVAAIACALTPRLVGARAYYDASLRIPSGLGETVDDFLRAYSEELEGGGDLQRRSLALQLDLARRAFGERWGIYKVAAVNAGSFEYYRNQDSSSLALDRGLPLLERAIYARSYRGPSQWWCDRLCAPDSPERLFWLTILLGWAPAKHVSENAEGIQAAVKNLSGDDVARLRVSVREASIVRRRRGAKDRVSVDARRVSDPTTAHLLVLAFGTSQIDALSPEMQATEEVQRESRTHDARRRAARFSGWKGLSDEETRDWLECLRSLTGRAGGATRHFVDRQASMTADVAQALVAAPDDYPALAVVGAYQWFISRHAPAPVGDVAARSGWILD